jgi:DeoR/GlpR family transcriptional regulator of sugar metabolism
MINYRRDFVARHGLTKKDRQKQLLEQLSSVPFSTDEELGDLFQVSVQTIRLDRLELGIPELRERVRDVAENNYKKLRSIEGKEVIGELVDIELGKNDSTAKTSV